MMKMSHFWPKTKAIALVANLTMMRNQLFVTLFILKSDENQ